MIDLSMIRYRTLVIDENGKQYNIVDYIQDLTWEENENEISVRITFSARNDKTSKGYLSKIIKPGCLIGIFATDGVFDEEVARGYVETWNPSEKNSGSNLKCVCYDELYKLQKSQDNRYFASGTGTKSALSAIFNDWKVPQAKYEGPNVKHGKMVYNNRYLSDIILDILDDATKKGGEKCLIRASGGAVKVLTRGKNKNVYVFRSDNTQSFSKSVSTADLITRVKVIGQENGKGKRCVYATLDGKTQYGIRQRIYVRGKDESLSDAKSAAKEILKKEGRIERKVSVSSPDIPFVRKGDLIYVISTLTSAYYYVNSIQHNVDTYSMTMELEKAETAEKKRSSDEKRNFKVGDIVNYHGGTHYVSSYPGAKGYKARAGKAKITIEDGTGKAHPWHLIHTDNGSNVYGWVDDGTFD